MREIRGGSHKGEGEIGQRFRRWAGSGLFLAGLALIVFDALHNFELSWPAMIGSRLIIPGLVLLVIEAVLILEARRRQLAYRRPPLHPLPRHLDQHHSLPRACPHP